MKNIGIRDIFKFPFLTSPPRGKKKILYI